MIEFVMKKFYFTLTALLAVLITATPSPAQNRKYDDYKEKVDSLQKAMVAILEFNNSTIPTMYYQMRDIQKQIDSLTALKDRINRERDSLSNVIESQRAKINTDRTSLRKEYIPHSELALTEVYQSKNRYSRDSLQSIMKSLTPKVRKSKAAVRLRQYLNNEYPSLIGTQFNPFTCYTLDGKKYDWSRTKGKKMLIILDGYYCMDHSDPTVAGRYLRELCGKTGTDKFALVPFLYAESTDQMKEYSDMYKIEDLNPVSDLEGELSELEMIYQVRATPTTIYVDENGIIIHYERGLDTGRLEEFVK